MTPFDFFSILLSLLNFSLLLGAESFCEKINERFRYLVFNKGIRGAESLGKDPEQILETVCNHFKVNRLSLNSKRRSSENKVCDVDLPFIRRHCSETLSCAGSLFWSGKILYSEWSTPALQETIGNGSWGAKVIRKIKNSSFGLRADLPPKNMKVNSSNQKRGN